MLLHEPVSLDIDSCHARSPELLMIQGEVGMKRIFDDFDHVWSLHGSASHATRIRIPLSNRASGFHQIVGRPRLIRRGVNSSGTFL